MPLHETQETANEITLRGSVRIPLDAVDRPVFFMTFDGFAPESEHFVIRIENDEPEKEGQSAFPLIRIHSECVTGDVFGSLRCDCGKQLSEPIEIMSVEGGIIVYLRQEGRGIGLSSKIDAYVEQDKGHDTYMANKVLGHPEDARDFKPAADILNALGIDAVRLLTNNPDKAATLKNFGIAVEAVVPTGVYINEHNASYLEAKCRVGGHSIDLQMTQI